MNKYYLLLNIITISSTYFHINYINKRTKIHEFNSLPDLIVDNLPDLSDTKLLKDIVDYSIFIWILPIILNKRFDLLKFFYKFISIIYFLRTLTKFFTIMPSQGKGCTNDIRKAECYLTGYCNDKIFSGHTSITLALLLITIDNKLIDPSLNPVLVLSHIFYVLLILSAKYHYSVDVILSYIITISLFFNFKGML
jgi:hypothetical protein